MNQPLQFEELENRLMLSTVSISATGQTGEENLVVTVGGNEVINETIPTSGSEFSFDLADNLTIEDVRINFTNDLFEPGIRDRNLVIDRLDVNGEEIDLFGSNVFSSGTFLPGDGIQPGFGRGNILHSNGFIQVELQDADLQVVEFNGFEWEVSRTFTPEQISFDAVNDELVINGIDREISIARQVDIVPGSLSRLTVDAWRNQIAGSFDGSFAGAGIDFFAADGSRVGAQVNLTSFQLNENANDPSDRVQTSDFVVPENAATAYLWVWVGGSPEGTNIPLRLTDLRVEEVNTGGDTTPPTVTVSTTQISQFGSDAFFSVNIEDDTQLVTLFDALENIELRLTDPAGNLLTPAVAAGTPGTPAQFEISFRVNQEFDTAGELLRGEYQVELVGGTLADANGNFAPDQFIGTFTLV